MMKVLEWIKKHALLVGLLLGSILMLGLQMLFSRKSPSFEALERRRAELQERADTLWSDQQDRKVEADLVKEEVSEVVESTREDDAVLRDRADELDHRREAEADDHLDRLDRIRRANGFDDITWD